MRLFSGWIGEVAVEPFPGRRPLDEAIDPINEMCKAKGVDVNTDTVSGFIKTCGIPSTPTTRPWP
jgi:hypothetical protein